MTNLSLSDAFSSTAPAAKVSAQGGTAPQGAGASATFANLLDASAKSRSAEHEIDLLALAGNLAGKELPVAAGSELPVLDATAELTAAEIATAEAANALLLPAVLILPDLKLPADMHAATAAGDGVHVPPSAPPGGPLLPTAPSLNQADRPLVAPAMAPATPATEAGSEPAPAALAATATHGPSIFAKPGAEAAATAPAAPAATPADTGVATAELLRGKTVGPAPKPAGHEPPASTAALAAQVDGSEALLFAKRAERAAAAKPDQAAALSLAQTADPALARSEAALAAPLTSAAAPGAAGPIAQPHLQPAHLSEMIDRLFEARQSAGAGNVKISVAHEDFGPVGIRLEHAAGAGLAGFALSSSDPAFAPAVQAALAERSQAERNQAERQQAQAEQARSEQSAARGDGLAQENGRQAQHSRASGDNPHSAPARNGGTSADAGTSRSDKGGADAGRTDTGRADARGHYA